MTTENKDTTIVKRDTALPVSFDEINFMAKAFVASGMFQDTKQLSQAIVKIQAGRELGLPPVYSMQNINMIRNRLTSSANTMAMLVKRSGRYNYRIKEHTDKVCTITFFEKDGEKWVEVGDSSFSIEDAKRAELVKPESGWVKYPRAMLFSRAISQGARTYAPDAIGGMYTDEEIRSIPPRPNEESNSTVTIEEPAKEPEPTPQPVQSKSTGTEASTKMITDVQYKMIQEFIKANRVKGQQIRDYTGKQSAKDLTEDEAAKVLMEIQAGRLGKPIAETAKDVFPDAEEES